MEKNVAYPIIRQLLRLFTPEEINELTTTSIGRKKVSLTQLVTKRINNESISESDFAQVDDDDDENAVEHEAKILDFNSTNESDNIDDEQSEEAVEEYILECGQKVEAVLRKFQKNCSEWDKKINNSSRPKRNLDGVRKKEVSTFILEEKQKIEKSYSMLKSVEIMALYRKNSQVDIEQQKNNKDDLNKAAQSGLLINKKQA